MAHPIDYAARKIVVHPGQASTYRRLTHSKNPEISSDLVGHFEWRHLVTQNIREPGNFEGNKLKFVFSTANVWYRDRVDICKYVTQLW